MAQGVGIGAGGVVGLALETVPGTYVAPTKFFPITSESLKKTQAVIERRPLRGVVDVVGTLKGFTMVEGDIEMECYEDVLPYLLLAGRTAVVKTGSTPNFIYTATGTHAAEPADGFTLSITVMRNGETFGYVGCTVGSFEWGMSDDILTLKVAIAGLDEATQSDPTASYSTVGPFGPGDYTYSIGGSSMCDMDTAAFTINDNASAEKRLCQRAAKFVRWGERTVSGTVDRDFLDRTDYDAYIAQTSQAIIFTASKGSNNQVVLTIPVALKGKYEFGLQGQTDLIRASIDYIGVYDPTTTAAWKVVVKTQEDITLPS